MSQPRRSSFLLGFLLFSMLSYAPLSHALGSASEKGFRVASFPDTAALLFDEGSEFEAPTFLDPGVKCSAQTLFSAVLWVSHCEWIWYTGSDTYLEADYPSLKEYADLYGIPFSTTVPEDALSTYQKHEALFIIAIMIVGGVLWSFIKFGAERVRSTINPDSEVWLANLFKLRSDKADVIALGFQFVTGSGHFWIGQTRKGLLTFLIWFMAVLVQSWPLITLSLLFCFDAYTIARRKRSGENVRDWEFFWNRGGSREPKIEHGLPIPITIKGLGFQRLTIGGGTFKLGRFSCPLNEVAAFEYGAPKSLKALTAIGSLAVDLLGDDDGQLEPDPLDDAGATAAGKDNILKMFRVVMKERDKRGRRKRPAGGVISHNTFRGREKWALITSALHASNIPVVEHFPDEPQD